MGNRTKANKAQGAPSNEALGQGKRVEFENTVVKAVLNDGKETATHFHCSMEDGTTKHVPKELFEGHIPDNN